MLKLQVSSLLYALFLFFCFPALSQDFQRISIPVTVNNKALAMPLAGGLNAPQASAVDLNNDGIADLCLFDRVGNIPLTFLNAGTPDEASYSPAFEYAENFPAIDNWVLLRDYNGDGIQDMFAYSDVPGIQGIIVYRGYYRNDSLNFERIDFNSSGGFNVLYTRLRTGGNVPLFVSSIDYPAIDDIDCDGDLDVLTFNVAGGFVEWHTNRSVELGYGLDTLIYRLEDPCWGGFYESGISEEIDLSPNAGTCVNSLLEQDPVEKRHAGSTLLSLDLNGDDAKELILGDITFNNLVQLSNGGSCEQAWMNAQEPFFPGSDVSVNIPVFPAAFYLDLNNDGTKDFLAAPNAAAGGEDVDVLWRYNNIGNIAADLEFVQSNFLVGEMLDFGSGANPAFVDYNGDGLIDLLIGNNSRYVEGNKNEAQLFLLENTGSPQSPAFELVDADYLGLSKLGFLDLSPAFADIDEDGDDDLFVGNNQGTLVFLENNAGRGQSLSFGQPQIDYQGIDVGAVSVPSLMDVDADGKIDLIVGESDGNVNLFRNIGTRNSPMFNTTPDEEFWGGINTTVNDPLISKGNSAPVVYKTKDGLQLLAGSRDGAFLHYRLDQQGDQLVFLALQDDFGGIHEGFRTNADFADLNGDGILEVVIGNQRGGIAVYGTTYPSDNMPTAVKENPEKQAQLFPNPTRGRFTISTAVIRGTVRVYNAYGILVRSKQIKDNQTIIDLSTLPDGLYGCVILVNGSTFTVGKVLKTGT